MPVADAPLSAHEIRAIVVPLLTGGACALAVSGGPDSTQLMHMVAQFCDETKPPVLTVDHGLRPGSAEEAIQVSEVAAGLGLHHSTLVWRGKKPKTGLQMAAREARYRLMAKWCLAHGISRLVTAHNLEDQAETLLMRLARGPGLEGLSAMAFETELFGITILRPLLGVSHKRLVASLTAAGHTAIEDPSNHDLRFERVRVRNARKARDQLGLKDDKLALTATRMARAAAALEDVTSCTLKRCAALSPFGHCTIDRSGVLDEPDEIIIRVLSKCLTAIGGSSRPLDDQQLVGLMNMLRQTGSKPATLGGCRVVTRKNDIIIGREFGRIVDRDVALPASGKLIWDNRFEIIASSNAFSDVRVGPLSPADWIELKSVRPDLPAFIGHTLPAVRRNGRLLAAPLAGFADQKYMGNKQIVTKFLNSLLL